MGFVLRDVSIVDVHNAFAVFMAACALLLVGTFTEVGLRCVFPVAVTVGVLFAYARICASFVELDYTGEYYQMYLSDWRWALISYGVSVRARVPRCASKRSCEPSQPCGCRGLHFTRRA